MSKSTQIVLSILLSIMQQALIAQTLSPTVIASTGNHAASGNVQMSYTIGEAVVTTLSSSNTILTQGFHQHIDISVGIVEGEFKSNIKIYPNPADNEFYIETEEVGESINYSFIDANGRILKSSIIHGISKETIDVSALPSAAYQLILSNNKKGAYKTYNVLVNK